MISRFRKRHQDLLKVAAYTFVLFFVQTHWIARLHYRALRVDLLIPAMVGIALLTSPVKGLAAAFLWGYIVDVLSGKFWGLHIGTYMTVVLLVHVMEHQIQFRNPLYQMSLILFCVLAQSFALGLYLWIKAPNPFLMEAFLRNLVVRSLLTTALTPLIVLPILKIR